MRELHASIRREAFLAERVCKGQTAPTYGLQPLGPQAGHHRSSGKAAGTPVGPNRKVLPQCP
jgi:hypothetical protein